MIDKGLFQIYHIRGGMNFNEYATDFVDFGEA